MQRRDVKTHFTFHMFVLVGCEIPPMILTETNSVYLKIDDE